MDLVAARNTNFNLICRLCLSTDDYLLSIFDENHTFLPQRIAACVNVEIIRSDKMPTTICKLCLTKIDEWVNFKKCCDDSQAKLRQWASINNIILNKTANMCVEVKDHESDSEDIQIIENEITFIKEEPEEEIYLQLSDTEETETEQEVDPFGPQCDLQESTTLEVADSLLVPTSECSVADHGMNAPNFVKHTPNSRDIHPKVPSPTVICRICYKRFSSVQNRIRHERDLHFIKTTNPFDKTSMDSSQNFNLDITNIHSLNSSLHSDNTNYEDYSTEVSMDRSLDNLELSKITTIVSSKPNNEKHFLEFYGLLSQMLDKLTCFICGAQYQNSKGMLGHMYKTFTLEKFTCFLCCISFPNRSLFMKHRKKQFCAQRYRLVRDENCSFKAYQHYQCIICEEIHVHKLLLNSHLLGYHLMTDYPSSCEHCSKQFQDANEYKEHLQGSCFYKLYCSICNKSFGIEDFSEHCKIHDDNNVEFNIYDYMNSDFDCRSRSIKIGCKNENGVNMYSCSQCGAQFPTLDLWCEHQQSHSDNNVHRCTECNRVFVTELELEQHRSTHSNNNLKLKLYRCSDTNSYKTVSDFSSSSNSLKLEQNDHTEQKELQNVATVEEKKFKCTSCQKLYPTERHLRAHKKIHTNKIYNSYRTRKRRSARLACPKCKKICSSGGGFARHKIKCFRIKENNVVKERVKRECRKYKPIKQEVGEYSEENANDDFRCQVCAKSFLTEKGLILHSKTHTDRENDLEKMQCQVCSKKFISIQLFLDHLKSHSTKSLNTMFNPEKFPVDDNSLNPYCEICDKVFTSNIGLSNHMRIHECTEQKPQCKICDKVCLNNAGLSTHMKLLHDFAEQKPQCKICDKVCMNNSGLASHMRLSHESTEQKPQCKICDKVCMNMTGLNNHMKFIHNPSEQKPQCKICKKVFLNNTGLSNHMRLLHEVPEQQKLQCKICDKVCMNNAGLHNHMRRLHDVNESSPQINIKTEPGAATHVCNFCNMEFESRTLLNSHVKIHLNGANIGYNCTFCPKVCTSSYTLEKHVKFRHPDAIKPVKIKQEYSNFSCHVCNKTFLYFSLLEKHLKIHAKAPVAKKFKCNRCSKNFSSALVLKRHVLDCLYCKKCNKYFATFGSLKTHKGWHTRQENGEPFSCAKCNTEFDNQSEYLKHIKTHRSTYRCKICTKAFYSMKTLLAHTAVHKNDAYKKTSKLVKNIKPRVKTEVKEERIATYRCTECNTTFVNSKQLRLHVLSTHMTEDV